jgi:hypothetical protein
MPYKDPIRARESARERQRLYRERHREKVLERNREALRRARAIDPERFKAYWSKWESANPERRDVLRKRQKDRYAADPARRKKALSNAMAWQKANPERVRANHKAWRDANPARWAELMAKAGKKWRDANPEALRDLETTRKRAKMATPLWGEKDKIRLVYKKAREWGFEVDHVVPLKHPLVCGLHVWANLQLLHRTVNRAKRNFAWPDMP